MCKKVFVLFLASCIFFSNTSFLFAKGGFFVLDGPPNGVGGVTGGTVEMDWRDFEPTKGNYQWQLIDDPSATFVPWKAYWKHYECRQSGKSTEECNQSGISSINPRPVPAASLHSVSGTTMRFKLRITDGGMPLWLFGGTGHKEKALGLGINGTLPNLTGGKICGCTDYCYMPNQPVCHGVEDIVHATTLPLHPSREDNAHPIWWNTKFQEELQTTLLALGNHIESNSDLKSHIEFVEASVGNFGEMILYGKTETFWAKCNNSPNYQLFYGDHNVCECHDHEVSQNLCPSSALGTPNYFCTYNYKNNPDNFPSGVKKWMGAGYTNKRYFDAVMNILGFYIEAFPTLPIALSVGTGLYPGNPEIYNTDCSIKEKDDQGYYYHMTRNVLPAAMAKWGSRIYLKFAGFGIGGGYADGFTQYCRDTHITRCIYESFGGITQWSNWSAWSTEASPGHTNNHTLEGAFIGGANNGAYIIMMWYADFMAINNLDPANKVNLFNAFKNAAPYLIANGAISLTPPPPLPTLTLPPPTPTPTVNITLTKGWNRIRWLPTYPDRQSSTIPAGCRRISSKILNFWNSYQKNYGGENLHFANNQKLSIFCTQSVGW